MVHLRFLWPTIIAAGIGAAFLSVIMGNGIAGYGFPLVWRTGGCPPPGIQISASCLLAISYDWIRFGLDALFYTVIASVLFFYYTKRKAQRVLGVRKS